MTQISAPSSAIQKVNHVVYLPMIYQTIEGQSCLPQVDGGRDACIWRGTPNREDRILKRGQQFSMFGWLEIIGPERRWIPDVGASVLMQIAVDGEMTNRGLECYTTTDINGIATCEFTLPIDYPLGRVIMFWDFLGSVIKSDYPINRIRFNHIGEVIP